LALIRWFEAESLREVLLAGACFGWMTEGMLVGTLYGTEDSALFPFSVVCTGLSWHALISVGVGWYAVQHCCRGERSRSSVGWAVLLGVFWGVWATFLWSEKPPVRATVGAFAGHAFVMGLLFFASHTVVCRLDARRFHARPLGLVLTGGVLLVFYAQQVKMLGARPLVVLPVLLGAAVWAMSRGWRGQSTEKRQEAKKKDEDETTREAIKGRVAEPPAVSEFRPGNAGLGLLLMPLVATLVYAGLSRVEGWERVPVAKILMYWVTAPVGAAMFVWAFCRSVLEEEKLRS